jgi:hypothetical protein
VRAPSKRGELTFAKPSSTDGPSCMRHLMCSRDLTRRSASLVALCGIVFFCLGLGVGRCQQSDQDVDWARYASAVEFCRGDVERPISLGPDKRILCYDGWLTTGQDVSLAQSLADEGLFVVRSFGGSVATAIGLANVLRDRRATVVVYDYCNSACAGYLFIASTRTFVLKNTLVAWHHRQSGLADCPSLKVARDGGPKRLELSPCSDVAAEDLRMHEPINALHDRFYAERTVDSRFEFPPESFTIRRILRNMFEARGLYPDVAWTWNPRYYKGTLKANIIYEAYPESQDEVDAMVNRLHLRHVIYDP